MIYVFAKFFSELRYAESMLDGLLFMNTIAHFSLLEDSDDSNRPDKDEGLIGRYHPSTSILRIGDFEIPAEDLAAPTTIRREINTLTETQNTYSEGNVFCMSCIHNEDFEPTNDADLQSSLKEMKEHMLFTDDVYEFGQYVVVVFDAEDFIRRFAEAAKTNKIHSVARGLIRYYNDDYSGLFPEDEIGFHKHIKYAHQREYRLLTRPSSDAAMILNIGDIRDIATVMTSTDLKSLLNTMEITQPDP